MRRSILTTLALVLVLPLAAQAQTPGWPPPPTKYENVAWYTIWNVQFTGPNAEAATNALMDVFVPAFAASGNPVRAFEHSTGEWSVTLIIPMEGPSALEWDISPEISQMLAEVGPEKAEEFAGIMSGAISRQSATIVRERKGS